MTGWLERLFNWNLKYGYYIAYIIAAVIAISTTYAIYCYVHPHC